MFIRTLSTLVFVIGYLLASSLRQNSPVLFPKYLGNSATDYFGKVAPLVNAFNGWKLNKLEMEFVKTLREILQGPLSGRLVTILFDENTYKMVLLDTIIATLEYPLSIILIKGYCSVLDASTNNTMQSNYSMAFLVNESSSLRCKYEGADSLEKEQLFESVLVYVTRELDEAGLTSIANNWSTSSLIMISLEVNCDIETLFEGPLTANTADVVLMCPVYIGKDEGELQTVAFRLFSDRPFHPDQSTLFLGSWRSSEYPTWNDIFVDRFSSFYGSSLQVSSDRVDLPFLFLDEEGNFEGISKRILDSLSQWLNFTFSLTERADDGTSSTA
ncbi:hypothetical protein SK128_025397 [Halocaridina rubra]|uniref:Uncharacterized protein n=1 Tax=Halocaridina rubra TaxID=373956 RepID=A0AAN8WI63_HALRR